MRKIPAQTTELQKKSELIRRRSLAPQGAYRPAQVNRQGLMPTDLLALQRTVGNRQVQRMVAQRADPLNGSQPSILAEAKPGITVQTKHRIGTLNDIREPRSDRRAEQVMTMPQQGIQGHPPLAPAAQPAPQPKQPAQASQRAEQIFQWMEKPLQQAVKKADKIDEWNDSTVAGLVLIYNKMKNEDVWQYVKEITNASPQVSVDFLPIGGQATLKKRLAGHQYKDIFASFRLDWGLRKEKACGPHLHFKHFQATDPQVNVHIDTIDPACRHVPIVGLIVSLLRHVHHDLTLWSQRHPDEFLKLLQEQHVPLSTGLLDYLKQKGYMKPIQPTVGTEKASQAEQLGQNDESPVLSLSK